MKGIFKVLTQKATPAVHIPKRTKAKKLVFCVCVQRLDWLENLSTGKNVKVLSLKILASVPQRC